MEMYGISGQITSGLRGVSWQLGACAPYEHRFKTGLCIKFPLGVSSTVNYRRFELTIADALEGTRDAWLSKTKDGWLFDSDWFYKQFDQAPQFPWLRGVVQIEPEFEVQQKPKWMSRPNSEMQSHTTVYFVIAEDSIMPKSRVAEYPVEITDSLKRLVADYPDPLKVGFVMMPFSNDEAYIKIRDVIFHALRAHGLAGVRADTKQYHDDLFLNVQTYMHGCGFGIAVFDRMMSDDHNPNVALELGYMMALRKPVLLLKDRTLKTLTADVVGKLYEPFDTRDPKAEISDAVERWLGSKGLSAK